MRVMNPSVMVSRLDLVFLELTAAGIVFRRLPLGFWIFKVFIEQRGGAGGHRGGHNTLGRAWAPRRAQVGFDPSGHPSGNFLAHCMSSGPKKSPKSFVAFGLCLVLIFCKVKNKQKTTAGTWHYVNRLVPKNDIKLL